MHLWEITHEAYLHLIKSIALSKPNCVFLVLPAFRPKLKLLANISFENFLMFDVELFEISNREMIGSSIDYPKWIKHTGWDARINHLSLPNLHILANELANSITNFTTDNLTYDKFQTSIMKPITSTDQYLDYVSRGLVDRNQGIINQLTSR
jgi:hypothetical protein